MAPCYQKLLEPAVWQADQPACLRCIVLLTDRQSPLYCITTHFDGFDLYCIRGLTSIAPHGRL